MDDEILLTLHTAVAQTLLDRIKAGDAKSSDLGVAVRFLKDNGIEAAPVNDNPLARLLESLPFDEEEEDFELGTKH
jgi:hypothetical protein